MASSLTEEQRARSEATRADAPRRQTQLGFSPTHDAATQEQTRLSIGKHAGKTFAEVVAADPGYCTWAQKVENPSGPLKQFVDFVAQQKGGTKRNADVMRGAAGGLSGAADGKRQRVQDVARPSIAAPRFFKLQRQYMEHIKSGRKRWEGRLNVGAAAGIIAGSHVTFSTGNERLDMLVKSVRKYSSFESMLRDLGVDTCLPGVTSLTDGIAVYHSFPGYAQKERQFGVLAMELIEPGVP